MATPGNSTVRQPHSTAAAMDHSVESSLSGLGDSVAQAGPPWRVPDVDLSEGHSHGGSQLSEAVSGQIRNAASAAFSSKSIGGESAFSQNVDACSISQIGSGKLRRRLNSAEEISTRRFDVRPDQSGPPISRLLSHQNRSVNTEKAQEIVAGQDWTGSGSHHAQLFHQMSIPSNVAIEISSRGGGTSISQAAQGQNFQTGTDLEVEMPKSGQRLLPGHPGSSLSIQQVPNQLVNPDLGSPREANRLRRDVDRANEDQCDIQGSISVTQRGKDESLSAPLHNLLAMAPTVSTAHILSPQRSLRHSLQAMMERTLSSMRGADGQGGSASRNNDDASPGFALPRGPLLTPGASRAAANSGGCMVASAHGTIVPDDVVSDADTDLAFLHRRQQDQGQLHHQNVVANSPPNEVTQPDRSVSGEQRPAFTAHTVVGSVEENLGDQHDQVNGNHSAIDRQASFQSGNPSTVNMSHKDVKEVMEAAAEEMLDTAQSENSDERRDGESPKSVTGIRQGSSSGANKATSLGTKEDNAEAYGCAVESVMKPSGRPSEAYDQTQSPQNPAEQNVLERRISRTDSIGSQCRKRKYASSTSTLHKSNKQNSNA